MADIVNPEKRSQMMSGIRGKDTKPEILIRKGLYREGFRYRLHRKDLPGSPDLVFPKYSAVIFIQGCFWHKHSCHLFKWPTSRADFWRQKILTNQERDIRNFAALAKQGWRVLQIWECALKGKSKLPYNELIQKVAVWLKSSHQTGEITGVNAKR